MNQYFCCKVCGNRRPVLWPFCNTFFHRLIYDLRISISFTYADKICCKCRNNMKFLHYERTKMFAANTKFVINANFTKDKVRTNCCRFCSRETLFPHNILDEKKNIALHVATILRIKVRPNEKYLTICNICCIRLRIMNTIYQKINRPFIPRTKCYQRGSSRMCKPYETLFYKEVPSFETLTFKVSTTCPICGINNPSFSHFQNHVMQPIICAICRGIFPNLKSCQGHGCTESIYNCERCPAKFRYKSFYDQHKNYLHPTPMLPEISKPVVVRKHFAIPKHLWNQKLRERSTSKEKLQQPNTVTIKMEPQVFHIDLFDERQTMDLQWSPNCITNDLEADNSEEMFNVNVKEEIDDEENSRLKEPAIRTYERTPRILARLLINNFEKFAKKGNSNGAPQFHGRKLKINNNVWNVVKTKRVPRYRKAQPEIKEELHTEVEVKEEVIKPEIEEVEKEEEIQIEEMEIPEVEENKDIGVLDEYIPEVSWEDLRLQAALPWSDQEEDNINVNEEVRQLFRQNCNVRWKSSDRRLPKLCHICGIRNTKLEYHLLIKHSTEEARYKCDKCSRAFVAEFMLTKHFKRAHALGPLNCDICGNHLRNLQSLRRHRLDVHLDTSIHCCKECKRVFPTKSLLKNHMKQHSNIHPFRCDVCGAAFKHNVSVKTHKRTAHNVKEPITDYCDICNKGFGSINAVYTHRRRKHPEIPPKL